MAPQTRRAFLATTSMLTLGLSTTGMAMDKDKVRLVHHVFFWLKNPEATDDLTKLIAGIRTMKKIETLRMIDIGIPANTTPRPIIDSTYSVSLLMVFDNVKDHDVYQEHSVHKKFIEDCSALWDKVQIYDSLTV